MLVRTHMQDLKDVTRETHYENYRAQCIQSMTRLVVKERNRKYGQKPGGESQAQLWMRLSLSSSTTPQSKQVLGSPWPYRAPFPFPLAN